MVSAFLQLAALFAAIAYQVLLVVVFCYQDLLVFPGSVLPMSSVPPVGPVAVERLRLPDGRTCRLAIARAPRPTAVVLWFVGNGEDLARCSFFADAVARTQACIALSVEYPGYGGRGSGRASRSGCLAAADAAAARAVDVAARSRLPLLVAGHSLGTFMATHVASKGIGVRLLLVAPPTRIVDRGAALFPYLPVRYLLRHDFDNLASAARIRCPTVVLHGTADRIVPVAEGRQVARAIRGSRWIEVRGGSHDPVALLHAAGVAVSRFLHQGAGR